jgi:hypothetical protein
MNGANGDEFARTNSPPMTSNINKNGASQSFLFFFKNRKNSLINDIESPSTDS